MHLKVLGTETNKRYVKKIYFTDIYSKISLSNIKVEGIQFKEITASLAGVAFRFPLSFGFLFSFFVIIIFINKCNGYFNVHACTSINWLKREPKS